jgi:hypothetical protein
VTAYRILRRLVRKATKPLRLWLNTRQLTASERQIELLRTVRIDAAVLEHYEHRRQVRLAMRRTEIVRW